MPAELASASGQPDATPGGESRTIRACCMRVEQETHDVATFVFRAPEPARVAFKPGQYVLIEPVIDGRCVQRCYTISSPPSRPWTFSITVKRVPGGLVSNWLHDHMQPGESLTLRGPRGDFNYIDRPAGRMLLLSGGSGITPVLSMTRWLHDTAADVDMVFVHSARTPRDIIARRELEALAARNPGLRVAFVCAESGSLDGWDGPTGHLDQDLLQRLVPDLSTRTTYVCGPEAYMEAVRKVVADLRLPTSQYHEESFGGGARAAAGHPAQPADEPVRAASPADAGTGHEVLLEQSGRRFQCEPSETLLQAATRNGAWIPSACQMGVCGTCRVHKRSGAVDMEAMGGIDDADVAAGYVLACCSYPRGPVTLDC